MIPLSTGINSSFKSMNQHLGIPKYLSTHILYPLSFPAFATRNCLRDLSSHNLGLRRKENLWRIHFPNLRLRQIVKVPNISISILSASRLEYLMRPHTLSLTSSYSMYRKRYKRTIYNYLRLFRTQVPLICHWLSYFWFLDFCLSPLFSC